MDRIEHESTSPGNDLPLRYEHRSSVYISRAPSSNSLTDNSTESLAAPVRAPYRKGEHDVPAAAEKIETRIVSNITPALPRQELSYQTPIRPTRSKQRILTRLWKRKRFTQPTLLRVMAAIVLVVGAGVGINTYSEHQLKGRVQGANITRSVNSDAELKDIGVTGTQLPDESDIHPVSIAAFRTGPNLPQRITIDKLNINARVRPLSLDDTNQLPVPKNINDVGWYDASARPGATTGATLLNGHVRGPTKPGVLSGLNKLIVGDKITLERGDGKSFIYRVVKTETLLASQVDRMALMSSVRRGSQGLNIIASDVKYGSSQAKQKNTSLVVYTVLLNK